MPMVKSARRWRIAVLLGFGVLINYFDRVNVSVAQDALNREFGMTNETFGFVLSAYSWTYAALQLPMGVLLDRFGVRLIGCLSALVWSLASFCRGRGHKCRRLRRQSVAARCWGSLYIPCQR